MTMSGSKNQTLKSLIDAHGWLGVIISVALFIVFWAGSIIMFMPELHRWAETPAHPVDPAANDLPMATVVDNVLEQYPLNTEEHLTIVRANAQRPYHIFYIDLLGTAGTTTEVGTESPVTHPQDSVAELRIDPKTGDIVGDLHQFNLPDFLFRLHYDLRLPGGVYLVGLVTLFFLVLIFTGIWIHAPKLFRHFFLYRPARTRNKLLDMHNIIGVMSLPFSLMFALTGLIFNLSLVFQIAIALALYQGDIGTLLEDAGYPVIEEVVAGEPMDMSAAWQTISDLETEYDTRFSLMRFHHYGDQNGILEVYWQDETRFIQGQERYFRLSDGQAISENVRGNNVMRQGLEVVAALHFGTFAGFELRFLYFALGMGVAAMIVVGNLMWLDKRRKQATTGTHRFISGMTLGGCMGTVVATSVIFLAERILPLDWVDRGEWIGRLFATSLLFYVIACCLSPQPRQMIRYGLFSSGALALLTIIAGWVLYGSTQLPLWQDGYRAVIGVDSGLLAYAVLAFWVARVLSTRRIQGLAKTAPSAT